jgi:3-hydroxyacyl-[acyl-carrier-protein] dehydratase
MEAHMTPVDYGREMIERILPHRPPFLFVDRVVGLEAGVAIEAERDLRADEPHFAGHFPGRPIMPGVLIAEALAQAAGLLLALTAMERGERVEGDLFYLARADVKWTNPVEPGETLVLEARLDRALGPLVAFRVRAHTRRKDVAAGALTLAKVGG